MRRVTFWSKAQPNNTCLQPCCPSYLKWIGRQFCRIQAPGKQYFSHHALTTPWFGVQNQFPSWSYGQNVSISQGGKEAPGYNKDNSKDRKWNPTRHLWNFYGSLGQIWLWSRSLGGWWLSESPVEEALPLRGLAFLVLTTLTCPFLLLWTKIDATYSSQGNIWTDFRLM